MKTRHFRILMLAVCLILSAVNVGALDINGTFLHGYSDREGASYLLPGEFHGEFENPTGSLSLTHYATDGIITKARINASAGALTIAEAWLSFDGLPYHGELTVGRFQKPLGEPLLTLGLTYPGLLFHTSSVTGAKVSMGRGLWNWEIGVANANPLTAVGTVISGSPAFGRPIPPGIVMPEHLKEYYASLSRRFGGEWGSLNMNLMYTGGKLLRQDATLLATISLFDIIPPDYTRQEWDFAADYTYGDYRLFGEYAAAELGALTLRTYNISAARKWRDWEFVAGWDWLATNAALRPPSVPASWDRERFTLAANWQFTDQVKIMTQYEFNQEVLSGQSYPGRSGLPNDGIAAQIGVGF